MVSGKGVSVSVGVGLISCTILGFVVGNWGGHRTVFGFVTICCYFADVLVVVRGSLSF